MTAASHTHTESSASTQGQAQYLTFILAGEEYGIDILAVQEIRGWQPVTPLPNTPPDIRGVINLRGLIVPIVDLRTRFGLESIPHDKTTVVIVLRVEEGDRARTVGVVVDAVSDVHDVAAADRKPTPDVGGDTLSFVQGLATAAGKMIILLDANRLLHLSQLEDVLEADDALARR